MNLMFLNNSNYNAIAYMFALSSKYTEVCSCFIRTTMGNYPSLVLLVAFQFTL